jgi:AcrR family transcriptional regulator
MIETAFGSATDGGSYLVTTQQGSARGPRRTLRRDARLNREKILTVAAELMAQRGHNVPLAEIAEAAGVGVGTLYRAFPDRAALLQAMQLRGYNILIAALNRVEESGLTGADAVESWLNERVELGTQLMLPLHGAPPLNDDASIAARGRAVAALERFLADGRADGTVRRDVNATDIIVCAAMISQPLPHSPGWPIIAQRHISVFVDGIRASGRPLPGPPKDLEAMLRGEAPGERHASTPRE